MAWWFSIKLWKRVMLGLALGVAFGLAATPLLGAEQAEALVNLMKFVGDVFITMIRLVIIPLIFFTLVAGVLALGDPAKLGSIGVKTIFLYLATTFFANIIGLSMGAIFQPGANIDFGDAAPRELATQSGGILDRILNIVSKNPFEQLMEGDPVRIFLTVLIFVVGAFLARRVAGRPVSAFAFTALFALGVAGASGDILFVIFLSLFIGIALLFTSAVTAQATRFFDFASDIVLKVTHLIMEIAPFAVFTLIAWVTVTSGVATFTAIFTFVLAIYLGCLFHMAVVYGGIIKFGLGLPFINFFRGILDAQMVAFSTSSSSATLPVTMSNVTDNLGVNKSIAGSVLPLGATINMDGTSLYLGIMALFTAQAFGYTLEPYHYVMIALSAALVSIGSAGIPSGSLFLLATVLQVFDVSAAHTAIIIGFIFPFDRLPDMMRTVTNVTGDATVAVTVAKWEGEIDEDQFRAKNVE